LPAATTTGSPAATTTGSPATPVESRNAPPSSTPRSRSSCLVRTPPSVGPAFSPKSIIADFMNSDLSRIELPASLSSSQRGELHQLAQHFSLSHTSQGSDKGRFLTIAKPGTIIGEPTFRKLLASEVINQCKASEEITASANVDAVLASSQEEREESRPKRRGKAKPTLPVKEYNTRSKRK